MSEDLKREEAPSQAAAGDLETHTPRPSKGDESSLPVEGVCVNTAMSFLSRLRPDGPWTIMFFTDRRERARSVRNREQLERYLTNYPNEDWYFVIGEMLQPDYNGKPKAKSMKGSRWVWTELDPVNDENEHQLLDRLLACHSLGVHPHMTVRSGRGVWAYWELSDCGEPDEVEAVNWKLKEDCGGDHCWDISRVDRLPGTFNSKTGRMATWENHESPPLAISDLPKEEPQGGSAGTAALDIDLDADIPLFEPEDIAELAIPPMARQKAMSNPQGSRNENARSFLRSCLGGNVDHAVILGVCMSEAPVGHFFQHEHMGNGRYEPRRDPLRFARDQLSKALAEHNRVKATEEIEENDPIKRISKRYFGAVVGGRSRFYEDRLPLEPMTKDTLRDVLATEKVPVDTGKRDPVWKPAFPIWLESSDRRFYSRGFMLDPSQGHTRDQYNLWKGFSVEPSPGDVQPFLDHLLGVVEPAVQGYLLKWMAWVVRNPADKPRVAVVLRGDEGTGKGFICSTLMSMFGVHGQQLNHKKHIVGAFNAHMQYCCLLFADEVQFRPGDEEAALKVMITEPTMPIEGKGVDVKNMDSYLAMIMSTNQQWAVPATIGARRFVVGDVNSSRKGDSDYFSSLFRWREREGGLGHILHHLLHEVDLAEDWHPEPNRVKTQALAQQELATMDALDRWILMKLWLAERKAEETATKEILDWCEQRGQEITPEAVSSRLRRLPSWEKSANRHRRGWIGPSDFAAARLEFRPDLDWSQADDPEYEPPTIPF